MRILRKLNKGIEQYKKYLEGELFPALEEWGLTMDPHPINQTNTELEYVGNFDTGLICRMTLSSNSYHMDEELDKLFCYIKIRANKINAGGLTCDDLDYDFGVIVKACEDAGYTPEADRR